MRLLPVIPEPRLRVAECQYIARLNLTTVKSHILINNHYETYVFVTDAGGC